MQKVLKSGAGWRVGWNLASAYQGLVGGDDWAFELTAAELADFCRLLGQLVANMRSMRCRQRANVAWFAPANRAHNCTRG